MIGMLLFGLVMLLGGFLIGFLIGSAYGALCYRPAQVSEARYTEVEIDGAWVAVRP